jgi:uncharacterized protein (TIGR03792 family)
VVIEQLSFHVPVADQPGFLAQDRAIWTTALAAQPGYLGKEIWREADAPDRLHLIIRWADRAAWKAVPADLLARTDAAFVAATGKVWPVLRCLDQDVIDLRTPA